MKVKFTIASVILTLFLVSCNQEKKEVVTEGKPEPKVETFDVTVEVIVKKDDDLIVYYRDETNEWFDEDHAIWQNVKGSDQVQTLTFSLPEAVLPNNLRFDFSKNPEQEPVKILKIKLSYLGKSFEVNEENMFKYFQTNEHVKYDTETKLFTPIKNEEGVYDPFLSITIDLYNEIDKLIKGI
jgi:hypothetical protein